MVSEVRKKNWESNGRLNLHESWFPNFNNEEYIIFRWETLCIKGLNDTDKVRLCKILSWGKFFLEKKKDVLFNFFSLRKK